MSEATLDAAAKQRLKQVLLARADAELSASHEAVDDDDAAAQLDQDSAFTADDLSHADQEGDLHDLDGAAQAREEHIRNSIDALDVAPVDTVGPGAVVAFDGDHYVVGVVAEAVEVDGVTYEGISSDSPAYAAIAGLRAGDTFTLGGREHRLDQVA